MKKINQTGFSIVEMLLILVVIGILGFTGWFVYHAKQTSDKNYSATDSAAASTVKKNTTIKPATVTGSNTGYLVIKEWGVKIQSTYASDISYEYQGCPSTNGCSSYGSDYESNINISIKNDSDVVYRSQTKPVSEDVNGKPSVDNYKKVGAYYYWTQGAYGDSSLDKNVHADLLNIVGE